jgi:hypothetical protein
MLVVQCSSRSFRGKNELGKDGGILAVNHENVTSIGWPIGFDKAILSRLSGAETAIRDN